MLFSRLYGIGLALIPCYRDGRGDGHHPPLRRPRDGIDLSRTEPYRLSKLTPSEEQSFCAGSLFLMG